jgi:DnaJ-class molecular chaperone
MNLPPRAPETPDYYSILGVHGYATPDELQDALRHLRRKYHPESRLPGAEPNEERFKQVRKFCFTSGDRD